MKFARREDYRSIRNVRNEYPDACRIVPVTGGWAIFTTEYDYQTWRHQR